MNTVLKSIRAFNALKVTEMGMMKIPVLDRMTETDHSRMRTESQNTQSRDGWKGGGGDSNSDSEEDKIVHWNWNDRKEKKWFNYLLPIWILFIPENEYFYFAPIKMNI